MIGQAERSAHLASDQNFPLLPWTMEIPADTHQSCSSMSAPKFILCNRSAKRNCTIVRKHAQREQVKYYANRIRPLIRHHDRLSSLRYRRDPIKFISSTSVSLPLIAILLFLPTITSDFATNLISTPSQPLIKNALHLQISQLCASKSQFPLYKQLEGFVLSSKADVNVNCTIVFRTKSTQQHYIMRFEELKLGCDDHLTLFDGDSDYGQGSIKDFSCRDNLANAPIIQSSGTYLTLRYTTDSKAKAGDGFRLVATAVSDVPSWKCPSDYTVCHNQLCISRSLICDGVNHCTDDSDELGCAPSGSLLTNALGLLVVLALITFLCVIFIMTIYCRRESPHNMQREIPLPANIAFSYMPQPNHHIFHPQPTIVQYQNVPGIPWRIDAPQRL